MSLEFARFSLQNALHLGFAAISNRMKFGVWLLGSALLAFPLSAATYFVTSGGSGNGTSWSSSWNINTIGWGSLSGGDTVCIAGGNYSGSLTTGKGGSSGRPIVLKRAVSADATCGSSTSGWSSAFDSQAMISGIRLQNDYVTIDGAVANGIKMNLGNSSGSPSAIGTNGPTNFVTLRYVEVSGPCGSSPCNQNGDSRSIDLNHWNGSSYDLQNNMLIQYANFHGSCTIMWSAHSTNGIIEHSRFADSSDSTPGNPNCHPNVMATQDSTNMTFRYNEVTNWQVEGIMACPNGGCSSSWQIYGNLFHDPMTGSYPRILEAQGNTNGPYLFYNNTIVNNFYECAGTANGGSFASGTKGMNNIYWNSTTPCGLPSEDYDYSDASLSREAHGQGNAKNPFVNSAAKDYRLVSETNAGLALAAPFDMDYSGNSRFSWSRGAYQYVSGGTTPAPPTGLSVVVR